MPTLYVLCFANIAAASLLRPHRETLLVTDLETVDSQQAAYHDELTLLDTETRQLDALVLDVQSHLEHALKTLQSVGNASSAKANGTAKVAAGNVSVAKNATSVETAKKSLKGAATNKTNKTTLVHVMSKAEIKATLSNEQNLLKDLMKHLNNQIQTYNKQASDSKDLTEKMKKRFAEKLKKDEAALQQKGLSDFDHARLVNATRMDHQDLDYWTKDQELRHGMFHSNLKMSNTLLASVQSVLAGYNIAVAKGGVDEKLLKKVQASMLSISASFVQSRKDLQDRMEKYQASLALLQR